MLSHYIVFILLALLSHESDGIFYHSASSPVGWDDSNVLILNVVKKLCVGK